jgi:hypothetical protein
MAKMQPTGLKPEYLRELFDVLSVEPPITRWRGRPLAHFGGDAAVWKAWNANNAGQTIKPQADGRLRVKIDGRHVNVLAIIAEIGVAPVEDRWSGPTGGIPGEGPSDRLAEMREIAGTGPLALILRDAMGETDRTIGDLMVMGENDPYRIDTAAKRRDAKWFADQVANFVAPERRIHPRGVFYSCVSAPATKPDGTVFVNDEANEQWLGESSRFARWLGYIDFDRLVDNKNDEPVVRLAPEIADPTPEVVSYGLEVDELDVSAIAIEAALFNFFVLQPYRLVFFGEKTSLEDVLGPLAEEYGADLYLCGGQISDTLLHRMMKDAADDGRPMVVFTFSDCDPAGYWDMPTSIGRKLQALRDLKFPEVEFTVAHAALSPDQARSLDLPSSPLKDGEKRSAMWLETYGLEQTEIDALATLRPDVLERITREAVAPYYDMTLKDRVEAAHEAWLTHAQAEVGAQIFGDYLDHLKDRADDALAELRSVNAEVEAMRDIVQIAAPVPDLPEPDATELARMQDERRDAVLIESGMDYVEATDRLRAHNEMAARQEASRARRRGR